MTSKQNLRTGNIRAVTLAALTLFYKNGIDNSTINDIAALAGISKMSILRYFHTKAGIVVAATEELFKNIGNEFKKGNFFSCADTMTGMQLAENYLKIYPYLVDCHVQLLNYLCEVTLFFSKHDVQFNLPQFGILEGYWKAALERGMADKSIAYIESYETSLQTIHNLFMGICLRLYLKNKDLSSPDIAVELSGQTNRMVDIILKYLSP